VPDAFFRAGLCGCALLACLQALADPAAAARAAQQAAASDPACEARRMGDFYWEIGDATRVLASGSQGHGSVDASTVLDIASASKWIFGAYVLQKKGYEAVHATPALRDGLRFTSGYTDFKPLRCVGARTVGRCWFVGSGRESVPQPDPRTLGRFAYQAGHDQKLAAVDLGLGALTAAALSDEYRATLGLQGDISMARFDPLPAGGMRSSATAYADFLRRLLDRQLVIGEHLGDDAVCAQPKTCPGEAVSSPIEHTGEPWSYSYNHWVESRHAGSVDAFSSPGLYGFYPWISADRRFYGVLARESRRPRAYVESVACGRAIRKAFIAAW
jgi:CubicO group peptidase (beta-lactamase class C family)